MGVFFGVITPCFFLVLGNQNRNHYFGSSLKKRHTQIRLISLAQMGTMLDSRQPGNLVGSLTRSRPLHCFQWVTMLRSWEISNDQVSNWNPRVDIDRYMRGCGVIALKPTLVIIDHHRRNQHSAYLWFWGNYIEAHAYRQDKRIFGPPKGEAAPPPKGEAFAAPPPRRKGDAPCERGVARAQKLSQNTWFPVGFHPDCQTKSYSQKGITKPLSPICANATRNGDISLSRILESRILSAEKIQRINANMSVVA